MDEEKEEKKGGLLTSSSHNEKKTWGIGRGGGVLIGRRKEGKKGRKTGVNHLHYRFSLFFTCVKHRKRGKDSACW